ncbi:MAG: GNAT family N-acetyltransferase [Lachnospiraceae bacterium]|jgi:hypothetical protein|nr:GNAT family N-acetyltransferase [Lachnospiraceae bacterium]
MAHAEKSYQIRKSAPADLPAILQLYEDARAFMRGAGNPTQWGDYFPPVDMVREDIASGRSYVCVPAGNGGGAQAGRDADAHGRMHASGAYDDAHDDAVVPGDGPGQIARYDATEILAVFSFEVGEDPFYKHIDGAWPNDAPYGVVHRIATRRGGTRGVGAFCLEWCLSRCHNLRIDTHENNAPMKSLLAKLGFTYCGVIYMDDVREDNARLAYQCVDTQD